MDAEVAGRTRKFTALASRVESMRQEPDNIVDPVEEQALEMDAGRRPDVKPQGGRHGSTGLATEARKTNQEPEAAGIHRQGRHRCTRAGEGSGQAVPQGLGGQNLGNCRRRCPDLPRDIWQQVWDLLSFQELARLARVNREFRSGAAARTAAMRAEAVALVTAPESLPDSQLTTPQWAFRAITRLLCGLDAFSGEPFRGTTWGRTADEAWEWEMRQSRRREERSLEVRNRRVEADKYEYGIRFSISPPSYSDPFAGRTRGLWRRHRKSGAIHVDVTLMPDSPQEEVWMQGLLLALSDGTLGDLHREGVLPVLKGPLAKCVQLSMKWQRTRHETNSSSHGALAYKCPCCRRKQRPREREWAAPLMRLWGLHSSPSSPPITFERRL